MVTARSHLTTTAPSYHIAINRVTNGAGGRRVRLAIAFRRRSNKMLTTRPARLEY